MDDATPHIPPAFGNLSATRAIRGLQHGVACRIRPLAHGIFLANAKLCTPAHEGTLDAPMRSARVIRAIRAATLSVGFALCGFMLPAQATQPLAAQLQPATTQDASVSPPARTSPHPVDGTAIAHDARLAGDDTRTRLIVDLSHSVDIRAFTLSAPHRVVIDLADVSFRMEPAADQRQRGLITTYRYGVFAPGKARMVLDANGPVAIDKAFILDAIDDQPARLVVDLIKTDAESFARAVASSASTQATVTHASSHAATVIAPDAGDRRPVIVLDPGHGGIDSGTTGYSAFTEKSIVLETALALRDKLERSGTYRVVMTRSTDTFIALGERVRIARENHADLFISIHADALARGDGKARGASVYTLSDKASDTDAAQLAEMENKADLIAGIDLSEETDAVADILVELAQRETRSFSARFAHELVSSMKSRVNTHRIPLRSAGFRVLRAHDVPSVLLELGYMSSPEDLKQLTSEAWRDRMTDALAESIQTFFADRTANIVQEHVDTTGSIAARPGG